MNWQSESRVYFFVSKKDELISSSLKIGNPPIATNYITFIQKKLDSKKRPSAGVRITTGCTAAGSTCCRLRTLLNHLFTLKKNAPEIIAKCVKKLNFQSVFLFWLLIFLQPLF